MSFTDNFEAAKNIAKEAAQTAAAKAKELAAVAKANISIYAEEDKVKKAEIELGKLYYRDYAVGEEMDNAEYLPWCQKIDESKKIIAELKDYIASLRTEEDVEEAPAEDASFDIVVADDAPRPKHPLRKKRLPLRKRPPNPKRPPKNPRPRNNRVPPGRAATQHAPFFITTTGRRSPR